MKSVKKLVLSLLVLGLTLFSLSGNAQDSENKDKIKMNVLYVGYNPEKPMPKESNYTFTEGERFKIEYVTRWYAFKIFLENRFSNVKNIDARDYKENMSANYDVTIFDQVPSTIRDLVEEKKENGKIVTKYKPAAYLSNDYKSATIFVGRVGPDIGRSLGSKLDWNCYCLDADALDVQTEHPIFNTPIKVELTMTVKDTPENFYEYPNSKNIPQQIPMWRVQGLGIDNSQDPYTTGYPMGMISRNDGFLDSPDAEYISGGASSKNIEAIAIGRHGNFFSWGFSASPDHMTSEAQNVFTNAIVYMKQFNGTGLIAKKMHEGITIRDTYLYYMNKDINTENFETYKKQWITYKSRDFARKKELEAKLKKGEKLNKFQQSFLDKFPATPTLASWLPEQMGEKHFEQFGTNIEGFLKFLNTNIQYYTNSEEHRLVLDEDVKAMGISNRDIAILEKSIAHLGKGGKKLERAKRILKRYTEENFTTPKEWENWFKENRNKLFFTEAGGYKWLVDTTK
ncbi:hypothetical protein [Flavivirga eckloniae]|uniref:YARHG domain-containing protein n=1 Tax=Flavivirga eckloniae TaxID=1803846 RepID=A0A2K9PTX4_9FLAO|nr:hypothetical protein [Flavivirga eckloniae]AUP80515.1 hypothetical protein C1H87_18075 [Flavivirga eckloniae]